MKPISMRLEEQIEMVTSEYNKLQRAYILINPAGMYHVFHSKEGDDEKILRVEQENGSFSIAEYDLVGGINPSEYVPIRSTDTVSDLGDSNKKIEPIIRISDLKQFENRAEMVHPYISSGDQLIVIPRKSVRAASEVGKIVYLSGFVVSSRTLRDFKQYAKNYDLLVKH